jgi:DNA-binding CsgD family transcriptional regulator
VRHLVVFLNFAILCVGALFAVGFFRLYRTWRTAAAFWQLALFLAFTFTMAVTALEAYVVVNIGFGPTASILFASLVLIGSAAMLFVIPHGARSRIGLGRSRRFSAFWGILAALPAAAAIGIFFTTDILSTMALIGAGFAPFFASIVYSTALETRKGPQAESWIALVVLFSLAALEITWILRHPPEGGYFLVTLPVAYLYLCWSSWKDRAKPDAGGDAEDRIPPALAAEKGLTERELQIAGGILAGKSNKELAGELGIAENTTRNHIYNLYRKLGIQKRLDLVVLVRKYRAL